MKNIALFVAGVIFAIVALLHLLRVLYGAEIIFAGYTIPMWVSYLGFIIALGLSIWMFSARKQ